MGRVVALEPARLDRIERLLRRQIRQELSDEDHIAQDRMGEEQRRQAPLRPDGDEGTLDCLAALDHRRRPLDGSNGHRGDRLRDSRRLLRLQPLGQKTHSRTIEQCRDGQRHAEGALDLAEQDEPHQGIAAELEVIVLDAQALDLEHLLPDREQTLLARRRRRHGRCRQGELPALPHRRGGRGRRRAGGAWGHELSLVAVIRRLVARGEYITLNRRLQLETIGNRRP